MLSGNVRKAKKEESCGQMLSRVISGNMSGMGEKEETEEIHSEGMMIGTCIGVREMGGVGGDTETETVTDFGVGQQEGTIMIKAQDTNVQYFEKGV